MNIEHQDRQSVTLLLQPEEARRLLVAMRSHVDVLGEAGKELERELSAIGVTPPPPTPIREEYMPPLDKA